MTSRLAASFRVALRVDFARLRLLAPIRLAAPVVVLLAFGIVTDHLGLGVAAAIGSFMCGLADVGDCMPVRARVLGIAAVGLTLVTAIGGIVSGSVLLTIALSPFIAFVCAYASVLGPNASLTGTILLVMYALYAGAPVGEDQVMAQVAAVLAGCLLQICWGLAGWPLRRVNGMRGLIADTWRMFYFNGRGSGALLLSPDLPAQLVHCAEQLRWSETQGATRDWLQELLDAAERLRLPLAVLATRRVSLVESGLEPVELKSLTDLNDAVSLFSRAVSRSIVLSGRRRAVVGAIQRVEVCAASARSFAPVQVDAVLAACQQAAEQLIDPFPIGRRGEINFKINIGSEGRTDALKRNWHGSSPAMRHSIRLAVLTPIAWITGELLLSQHQYWVALTVAWVARPGFGTTFGRVVSRTAGTLIGLALVGGLIYVFSPGPWGLVLICGLAAYVLFAAMPVNYAFAVIFVTTLIVTLLAIVGDNLASSLANRALGTILGGLLTLVASQIGASWAAPMLAQKLAVVADETQRYVNAVFFNPQDLRSATGSLVNARRDAAAAIEEATLEPTRGALDPDRAARVLDAMLASIFVVASFDQGGGKTVAITREIDPVKLDAELADLEAQLLAIHDGRPIASAGAEIVLSESPTDVPDDAACTAVRRAMSYL